jgi:hypothetical protein
MAAMRHLSDVPPDDFVKARDALVKELRAKGQDDEAKAVAKLRKPPVALWIVNQLFRNAPAEVKALIAATGKLRGGAGLREAMQEQRDALARLSEAAGRAALRAGTKFTPELQRRVQTTTQSAAVAEPEALLQGSVEHELEATGFEGLAGVALAPPKRESPDDKKEKERQARALREAEHEAEKLQAHAGKLEHEAVRAEEAAAAARKEANDARRAAAEAAARVLELRRGS